MQNMRDYLFLVIVIMQVSFFIAACQNIENNKSFEKKDYLISDVFQLLNPVPSTHYKEFRRLNFSNSSNHKVPISVRL
jgi:hypothetical protein